MKYLLPLAVLFALLVGCSSDEPAMPTSPGEASSIPLSAEMSAMPITAVVPFVANLHISAYDGVRPYRYSIWEDDRKLSDSSTLAVNIDQPGRYTYTGYVTDAVDSTVVMSVTVIGTSGDNGDTTTVDCWQVLTNLEVGRRPDERESSATYHTSADGDIYQLWFRVIWDIRKEYQCWVAFEYSDGTERRFAIPDPHADRPIELWLDVGTALVEPNQRVRLWREKKGDPHSQADSGTIRLLEIKGCK